MRACARVTCRCVIIAGVFVAMISIARICLSQSARDEKARADGGRTANRAVFETGQEDQESPGWDERISVWLHAVDDPWIHPNSLQLLSADESSFAPDITYSPNPNSLPPYLPFAPPEPWLEEEEPAETLPSNDGTSLAKRTVKGTGYENSPLRYRIMWQPAQPVRGQSTDFALTQHDANVMVPVLITDQNTLALFGNVRADLISTDAVLPDSGRPFPSILWNIRGGVNYKRVFDNGWIGGGSVNLGSASYVPFGESRDINLGGLVFVRIPHRERNSWNLSLVYSPLSQIPYPAPLVAYEWQPNDSFTANLGLPFQITYKPTEQWKFDFSYVLMTTVHAQASYQFHEHYRVAGGFDWQNQSWFLQDRIDSKERLFLYDKRLAVSLQTTAMKALTFDFSTGYLFDRFYFTGRNYNDQNHDRIDIGSGIFVSAQAWLQW